MYHYFEAITNTSGDSLVGYFTRVIDPVTLNTITLSADDNGTPIVTISGVENMATTDAYGNLSFYVPPGTYHLDIYAPNATSFIKRVQNVAMNSGKGDPGTPGTPGAPGGFFIPALWSTFSTTTVPDGVNRFSTAGYERAGWGGAFYVRDTDQTPGAGPQPWRKPDAAGIWFKLDTSEGVLAPAVGLDPAKNEAQNKTALENAAGACASLGVKIIKGGCAFYPMSNYQVPTNADGITYDFTGSFFSTTSNAPIFTLRGVHVTVRNGVFNGDTNSMSATLGVPNKPLQQGIRVDGAGYARVIGCRFYSLPYGFYAYNAGTGFPLTGLFQQPSILSQCIFRACAYNMFFDDEGTSGTYGEYWRVSENLVTDATFWGLKCLAGNCSFENNSFMGNNGQVYLGSSVNNPAPNNASNSDHGHFVGNTVNHGLRCGVYIENPLRGWIVTNNHIWAHFGKELSSPYNPLDPTNGKLADLTGITDGTQNYAYGLFALGLHDSVIKDNKIRNNQVNAGWKFLSNGFRNVIRDNDFTADGNYSRGQTVDWSEFFYSGGGNGLGPNAYSGVWVDTTTFPNNGDWNRWIEIGVEAGAAFANGWTNYGNGFKTAAVRKDGFGRVQWRGLVKGTALNTDIIILSAKFVNYFSIGEGGIDLYPALTDNSPVAIQSKSDTRSLVNIASVSATFAYAGLSSVQYWVA